MKHLKTYEEVNWKKIYIENIKIGDYLLLGFHDEQEYKAKIIDKLPIKTTYTGEWGKGKVETEYEYRIMYIAKNDFFYSKFNSTAMNTLVKRFLTPEEIEEFKYIETIKNYNL